MVLIIEDGFTRSMLLSALKTHCGAGDCFFNSEIVKVGVGPLIDVLVGLIADDDLAAVKAKLGATTVAQTRKSAKAGLSALFEKLKDKAAGGAADLTMEALGRAALAALPTGASIAANLIHLVS